MKFGAEVDRDVMVRAFLRAELASPRFSEALRRLLRQRRLTPRSLFSPSTSAQRRWSILRQHRPGMLKTLPPDCHWYSMKIGPRDWSHILYMDHPDWKRLSGPSRQLSRSAKYLLERGGHPRIMQRVQEMRTAVRRKQKYEPIILITNHRRQRFVILEGHVRATTYATLPKHAKVMCIVGVSDHARDWIWW